MPRYFSLEIYLHLIAPWLHIASWNFSEYVYRGTWPVSNHSAIVQHIVSSRSYFVFSCLVRFCSVAIILILCFLCDSAGQHNIWSLVFCCSQRRQLSWACHFHFCRVISVGNRSLQIFTRATSLSILFRPRFKHLYAIECTVFLFHLFFYWRYCMYFDSANALMSWYQTLLGIVIPLISSTVGDDGYIYVIGLYATNWSWW